MKNKKFETYFDRNPPTTRWTKKDFRKHNLMIYSTGHPCEWYVRLILGVGGNSHGISISDTFKTKQEAEQFADQLANYMSRFFVIKEKRS